MNHNTKENLKYVAIILGVAATTIASIATVSNNLALSAAFLTATIALLVSLVKV